MSEYTMTDAKNYLKEKAKRAKMRDAAPEMVEALRYALAYTISNGDAHDRIRAALEKAGAGA